MGTKDAMHYKKENLHASYGDNDLSNIFLKSDLSYDDTLSVGNDLEIWKSYKRGDESAFIYIYERHFWSLLNYGLNFVANRELVKDCIQDMFIEIREKRKTISDTDSIKPFLFRILRRKIMRCINKYSRLQEVEMLPVHEKFQITASYEQKLIEHQISKNQIKLLQEALLKLSPKEREAISHFYFEGYSYQQITEIMGYSCVKTARSLVYKAMSSLKKILEPSAPQLFISIFL
jgi:RNA polymerase sigma factor (sigma-70 family)